MEAAVSLILLFIMGDFSTKEIYLNAYCVQCVQWLVTELYKYYHQTPDCLGTLLQVFTSCKNRKLQNRTSGHFILHE